MKPLVPNRRASVALVAVLAISLAGCASTAVHPGAANVYDSQAFDALIVTQAAIEQARVEVADGFPQYKDQLNKVIAAYNSAYDLYMLYHHAALTGGAPDWRKLKTDVDNLTHDLALVTSAVSGGHP
jgi:hypothetical protein